MENPKKRIGPVDFSAALPGNVYVDEDGGVSMEWYFGKQGQPDSWRILFMLDTDGVHVCGLDLKGEIDSRIFSATLSTTAVLVRLRELLQRVIPIKQEDNNG